MRRFAPLAAILLLLGCYDWSPAGRLDDGGDDDDDDSVGADDDDDSSPDDDDDDAADPCTEDVGPETIGLDLECTVEVEVETDPQLEVVWQYGVFETDAAYDQVMMTPIVVPLTDDDGDGVPSPGDARAIVFTTYTGGNYSSDGILRALRGDGTSLLWSQNDPAWRLQPGSQIAAGDIDNDGWPEIVGIHQSGVLAAFDRLGTPLWSSATAVTGSGGAPFLADMDGDGTVEIIHANQIFDSAGVLLGAGAHGTGATYNNTSYSASIVVDLDLDGDQEVVVGNALYDITGAALWANGQQDGCPGVGNFDSDPEGEIVVVSYGTLRVQDTNGDILAGPVSLPGDGNGGPPTVADFDGDGMPEIGVANLGFYTMFDTDLTQMWSNPTEDDSSSITGSSAFDFDADGSNEVVYADEHDVWVWHGAEGTLIHQGQGHASGTLTEYPIVAQVLAETGPPQIVVASNNMWWEGWTGITLLADSGRSWVPTRQVWNQHAFLSTHINDDLSVPTNPTAPWLEDQGTRSAEVTSIPGVSAPDLSPELHAVCEEHCTIRIRVSNDGAAAGPYVASLTANGFPVGTIDVSSHASGTLGGALDFVIDPDVVAPDAELQILIDSGDDVEECDESNNVIDVDSLTCE